MGKEKSKDVAKLAPAVDTAEKLIPCATPGCDGQGRIVRSRHSEQFDVAQALCPKCGSGVGTLVEFELDASGRRIELQVKPTSASPAVAGAAAK